MKKTLMGLGACCCVAAICCLGGCNKNEDKACCDSNGAEAKACCKDGAAKGKECCQQKEKAAADQKAGTTAK